MRPFLILLFAVGFYNGDAYAQLGAVVNASKLTDALSSVQDQKLSATSFANIQKALSVLPQVNTALAAIPANASTENLFGKQGWAKPLLTNTGTGTVLIIGDQIDLTGLPTGGKTIEALTVIARQIAINDFTNLRLQGKSDGGSLTLVALDRFIEGRGLNVEASGQDSPDKSAACRFNVPANTNFSQSITVKPEPGGNGGNVRIYRGAGDLPSITLISKAGDAGKGCSGSYNQTYSNTNKCVPGPLLTVFGGLKIPGPLVCSPNIVSTLDVKYDDIPGEKGKEGALSVIPDQDSLSKVLPPELYWTWLSLMLQTIELQAYEGVRLSNPEQVVDAFNKYRDLRLMPLPADQVASYNAQISRLNTLRSEVLPPLWYQLVDLNLEGGIPYRTLLLTDSESLKTRVAPTTAIVKALNLADKRRWGMIQIPTANAARASIVISAQLTVDPRVLGLLANQQKIKITQLGGIFTDWMVRGKIESIYGLNIDLSKVSVNGEFLDLTFVADTDSANLLIYKLATSPGVRIDMSWEYKNSAGKSATGPTFPIFLTLNKRQDSPISVDVVEKTVTNIGDESVYVSYLMDDVGKIFPFMPPLNVRAGAKIPYSFNVAGQGEFHAPAEAVDFAAHTNASMFDLFEVVADTSLVQTIKVTNLLPSFDNSLNEALTYVEIFVESSDTLKPNIRAKVGPIRLSSFGTTDAEAKIGVLKLPNRTIDVEVTGRALYSNGSIKTLKAIRTSDLSIKIDASNFGL